MFVLTETQFGAFPTVIVVKTDGAAVASGAITDALVRAKVLAETGVNYKEGWIVMTTTTVKVFIDVFIGIWAFILAIIWCSKFDKSNGGEKVKAREIWDRFPKFVLGYALTFIAFLGVCLLIPEAIENAYGLVGRTVVCWIYDIRTPAGSCRTGVPGVYY